MWQQATSTASASFFPTSNGCCDRCSLVLWVDLGLSQAGLTTPQAGTRGGEHRATGRATRPGKESPGEGGRSQAGPRVRATSSQSPVASSCRRTYICPSSASTLNQRCVGANQRSTNATHGKSAHAEPEGQGLLFTAIAGVALHTNRHAVTIPPKPVQSPDLSSYPIPRAQCCRGRIQCSMSASGGSCSTAE